MLLLLPSRLSAAQPGQQRAETFGVVRLPSHQVPILDHDDDDDADDDDDDDVGNTQ